MRYFSHLTIKQLWRHNNVNDFTVVSYLWTPKTILLLTLNERVLTQNVKAVSLQLLAPHEYG